MTDVAGMSFINIVTGLSDKAISPNPFAFARAFLNSNILCRMASDAGVGFTDVGSGIPGTDSSQFDSATFQSWGSGFYRRLSLHMSTASHSIGYGAIRC